MKTIYFKDVFTFRELGLHKIKDISKNKLRKAYEELWNHPEYYMELLNRSAVYDISCTSFEEGCKKFYRDKAIELAKNM